MTQVDAHAHTALTRMAREHVFVGHLDGERVLLQHGTKLFVVDLPALTRDLMYQLALRGYRRHPHIRVADAPPVSELLDIGLRAQLATGRITQDDGSVVRMQPT